MFDICLFSTNTFHRNMLRSYCYSAKKWLQMRWRSGRKGRLIMVIYTLDTIIRYRYLTVYNDCYPFNLDHVNHEATVTTCLLLTFRVILFLPFVTDGLFWWHDTCLRRFYFVAVTSNCAVLMCIKITISYGLDVCRHQKKVIRSDVWYA